MLFKRKPTEDDMVGVWKTVINTGYADIIVNNNRVSHTDNFSTIKIKLQSNGLFIMGEYPNGITPLYENSGRWSLSNDREWLQFHYSDGEMDRMDIRHFKGNTFTTTSKNGKDLTFLKYY